MYEIEDMRIVVIFNRPPIGISWPEGKPEFKRGAGGLTIGLGRHVNRQPPEGAPRPGAGQTK